MIFNLSAFATEHNAHIAIRWSDYIFISMIDKAQITLPGGYRRQHVLAVHSSD
jgi:hypothetical protein